MDAIHAAHAATHPLFYDRPEQANDPSAPFTVDDGVAWESWRSVVEDHWVHWLPIAGRLPEQGWKIHVSATPDSAAGVLAETSTYCNRQQLAFKHVRSARRLMSTLAKDCDRASSGKFITIYPTTLAELRDTLEALDSVIGGTPGPYILSDLRWRRGPLFVRYGAFRRQTVLSDGVHVPAIYDLGAERLVPDVRDAAFTVPNWVALPSFLREQLDALETEPPTALPPITSALHYSNAGGVYAAELDGVQIVLKEARPHAGWTPDGRDAVTRLRHEEDVLRRLPASTGAPRVAGVYTAHGHRFLALEYLAGIALPVLLATQHPLTTAWPTGEEVLTYRAWALDVAANLRNALAGLHAAGWVHGDLHPGNVLVTANGEVAIIDFEMSVPLDDDSGPVIGASGFVTTDGRSPVERDLYALACIELHLFLPLLPLLQLDPVKVDQLVRAAQRAFSLTDDWRDRLSRTLTRRAPVASRPTTPADQTAPDMLDINTVIAGLVASLRVDGDTSRKDRLWPGDPAQFAEPAHALAFGALGVSSALALAGDNPTDSQTEWIVEAVTRRSADERPGLMDGLAGTVWGCRQLGLNAEADVALGRLRELEPMTTDTSLYSGLPGIGLTYLDEATRVPGLFSAAADIAHRLREHLSASTPITRVPTDRGGLLRGASGTALLALRLYERTADTSFLGLARTALDHDIASLSRGRDHSLHVNEGWRAQPYLGFGSAGIGVALLNYLHHVPDDPRYRSTLDAIILGASAELTAQAGLLHGRAGLIHFLFLVERFQGASEPVTSARTRHINSLHLHALAREDGLRFAGNGLLRASCDLASGSAGVLTALLAQKAHSEGTSLRWCGLPYLTPGATPSRRDEGGDFHGVPPFAADAAAL